MTKIEQQALMRKETAYDRLPASIKQYYTEREYLWLPESRKRDLLTRELEPECDE